MDNRMLARRRVLNKLAQQNEEAEVHAYLKRAFATAMANSGVSGQYSTFINKVIGDTYQMTISFAKPIATDAKKRLTDNFNRYLQTNRPELMGKVILTLQ